MRFRLTSAILLLCSCALGAYDPDTHNASALDRGTLPDGRFPSVLPAIDGSLLTNLNASHFTAGTVPLAQLGGITNAQLSNSAAIDPGKFADTGTWTLTGSSTPMVIRSTTDFTNWGVSNHPPDYATMDVTDTLRKYQVAPGVFVDFPTPAIAVKTSTGLSGMQLKSNGLYIMDGTIPGTSMMLLSRAGLVAGTTQSASLNFPAAGSSLRVNGTGAFGADPFDSVVADLQVKGPQIFYDDTHSPRFYGGAAAIGANYVGHYGRGQIHYPNALFIQGTFDSGTNSLTYGFADAAISSGAEGNGIGSLIIDANNGASYSGVQGIVKVHARALNVDGTGGGSGDINTSGSIRAGDDVYVGLLKNGSSADVTLNFGQLSGGHFFKWSNGSTGNNRYELSDSLFINGQITGGDSYFDTFTGGACNISDAVFGTLTVSSTTMLNGDLNANGTNSAGNFSIGNLQAGQLTVSDAGDGTDIIANGFKDGSPITPSVELLESAVVVVTWDLSANGGGALWAVNNGNGTFTAHCTNNVSSDSNFNWRVIH